MMKLAVALGLAAAASAARTVSKAPYALGWTQASDAVDLLAEVKFTVVVKEQGLGEIKRIASEVSNPDSPIYGQYLSQKTIDDISRPAAEDMTAVVSWLEAAGVSYELRGISNLDVTANVAAAERLLSTKFHVASHVADKRALVRAGEYTIPDQVATVFGLHGLPVPKDQTGPILQPGMPVDVTPDVIYQTYHVTPQKVSRSPKNRQAVAEFQGQFMNSTDLKNMFKMYVKDYEVGVDDVVTKFVGEHIENSGGIEAELDIQYIMGVAPGIQTEFFEFPGQDFGADLNMWTSNLTSGDDTPLVHSVSYGWQGNLSQIGVKDSDVAVVDANFAKLAAKGISIMISSGDSGSGYAPTNECMSMGDKGVGIDGEVAHTLQAFGYEQCCEEASQMGASEGWTFAEWAKEPADNTVTVSAGTITFKKALYHDVFSNTPSGAPVFKPRDVFSLTGKITKAAGGRVQARSLNRTTMRAEIMFSAGFSPEKNQPQLMFFNVSAIFSGVKLTGRAEALDFPGQPQLVYTIEWNCPGHQMMGECYLWEHGANPPPPPPPPPPGTCTIYKTVTSHTTANSTTFSGFAKKAAVELWASWPASSPWVTAVGATRFVGQKVGNDEMATDQFGSGGGFSKMFNQDDAGYQSDAVAKYLKTVDPSTLPPAESFNPLGRATPDVAALGEGYQVIVGGRPNSVGGTSASSPAFAGLISLINEARMKAGKPTMGFLNPFLYKNEDAFFDVVLGSDKISRGGGPMPYGYNCSKGWDPATGLGTPLFDKLMAAAMSM